MAATRKRLLLSILLAAVTAFLIVLFSPVLVSTGVKTWLWWKTRGTHVTIKVEKIEAPYLRPITFRGVRLQTSPDAAVQIDVTASQVVFGLNVKGIFFRTRGRTLRNMQIQGLHVVIRHNRSGAPFSETGWNTIQRLLPESFALPPFDLRVEDQPTLILARGLSVTGTPVEAGRFEAAEIVVSSPLFRQTFSNLRGSTDWHADRLTVAALTLARGLDVQSITTDFSHLGKRRIGVEFDLDAFGGKLRGSVADEWRSRRFNWNIAGSANDISLSQTAEAFGFTDRVGGLVHAGKFTFRGDLSDPLTGTASLWTELTAPSWRDRQADVIMIGLSLYGRQIELQQLYIKQKKNELTLNGETSFPTTAAGWLRPDFRGTVSASIDDLGDFASLFGGNRDHFAGRIDVNGTLNARERNVGGNLVASGYGLTMFNNSIDEFHAELKLKRSEIEIAQLEFKRDQDSLNAQGKIETSPEHNYSGTIDATIDDLGDYFSMFDGKATSGTLHADVTSSVWDSWAVLDPPQSKPISMSATFPLRIGQPLSVLWNSPVTVAIDAPGLYLNEIPGRPGAIPFQRGTVTAQLTITDSFRHPRISGYAQLVGGKIGSTEADSRVRFDGSQGVIESLEVGKKPNTASLVGDVDLRDTEQLKVHLFPNQPLYAVNRPTLDCVNRVEIIPGTPIAPDLSIGEIELVGGISERNWTLGFREPTFSWLPEGFENVVRETFFWCAGEKNSDSPLIIGVETPPAPSPSPSPSPRPRKRKH